MRRAAVKWYRAWPVKLQALLLFACTAVVVGVSQGTRADPWRYPVNVGGYVVCIAMLQVVSVLGVFSRQRLTFYRESAAGLSAVAFGLGLLLFDLIDMALYPAIFMVIYRALTAPLTPWPHYYAAALAVAWVSSGFAYAT